MNPSGEVRIVAAESDDCRLQETAHHWDIEGTQGEKVVVDESAVNSLSFRYVSVPCPTGKVPIGGGAQIASSGGGIFNSSDFVIALTVNNIGVVNNWEAAALEMGNMPGDWKLIVKAICATVVN